MQYQTKHIENNFNHNRQSMTTGIAIKCSDGIVLASDSQGTQSPIKKHIRKIFNLNKNIGIVGAGHDEDITYLVNYFETIPVIDEEDIDEKN